MKKPSHNICRFSAKTARRRRLICFVFGFLVIAILAIGSALILAFDESTEPPSYTFEFTQSNAAPEFLNSFAKLGRGEMSFTATFSVFVQRTATKRPDTDGMGSSLSRQSQLEHKTS